MKKGATLSTIANRYYKVVDETIIDHIMKLNLAIMNPDLILVNQKIKIPKITPSSLIIQYSEHVFEVHLRTFKNHKSASQYKQDIASLHKEIAIVPWSISPGQTWYRVMAGPFTTRDQGLRLIEEMKQKGFALIPQEIEAAKVQ